MDEQLPCEGCIVFAKCKHKIVRTIMYCPILFKYIVEKQSSRTIYVNEERFYEFCSLFDLKTTRSNNRIRVFREGEMYD